MLDPPSITRQLYVKTWILKNAYLEAMSKATESSRTQGPVVQNDGLEEIDELFEAAGIEPVPVSEMMKAVEKLEEIKIPDEQLEDNDKTPAPSKRTMSTANQKERLRKFKGKEPAIEEEKPIVEDADKDDDGDYAESFATQHETAELREDFEKLSLRFKSLEEKVQLIIKERENLPVILNDMRADLNQSLTAFSDRMYAALEANSLNPAVQAALSTVENIRAEQADQLRVASSYLASDLKAGSPITVPGSSLKGKGKFKPTK
uniref:Uncharacterized protein n=1 Tax=Exserohilum turcicum mymonavirus 1 TaxID=3229033 RepID=A0AAU7YDF8_9MONO